RMDAMQPPWLVTVTLALPGRESVNRSTTMPSGVVPNGLLAMRVAAFVLMSAPMAAGRWRRRRGRGRRPRGPSLATAPGNAGRNSAMGGGGRALRREQGVLEGRGGHVVARQQGRATRPHQVVALEEGDRLDGKAYAIELATHPVEDLLPPRRRDL